MSRNNIKYVANLCQKSYTNNFDISKNILIDTSFGMQCNLLVNDDHKTIYIIFRGSDEIQDWISNLVLTNIYLKDNVIIHKGFYLLLQKDRIIHKIIESIEILKNEYNYDIIISGHSLGGALSQILAYELLLTNYKIEIIIFGMINIGNIQFQKKLLKKYNIIMINFINDIVYHLLKKKYKNSLFLNIIIPNYNKKNFIHNHFMSSYINYINLVYP